METVRPAPLRRIPVVIIGNTELVLHHGTLGIIRTLGRMGVPVYCVVKDALTPAAVSRYLTGAFVWNTRALSRESFLEGMHVICKQMPKPAILISTDDLSAILISECAAALDAQFVFPHQEPGLPRKLANKRELYLLCERLGVAYPRTVFPRSVDDLQQFIAHTRFPVVVKAAESWLLPKNQRTTTIARNRAELYATYECVESGQSGNAILQEYIPSEHGEDWFYHGYRNSRSNCCVGFTGRKLRSYPPLVGPTTLGKAIPNEILQKQAEHLLTLVSYSGIMDLDYRFDKRDGQFKLLDFNPRIGAQFRLFEDSAGTDVVRALYLDLTGSAIPISVPIASRTFIAEFHELAAELSYLFRGLALQGWSWTIGKKTEWAWFCRDDLVPFLAMCPRLLLRVVQRALPMGRRERPRTDAPRFVSGRTSNGHAEGALRRR